MADDDLLTIDDVCELAGFSRQSLHHHRTGRTTRAFPDPDQYRYAQYGPRPLWTRATVCAWIQDRPQPGRPRGDA